MSKFTSQAAVSAVIALSMIAGPALAKPAAAFECPGSEAKARKLLKKLKPSGAEVVDTYGPGTRSRFYNAGGLTVMGLPVYKLEVIIYDGDDYPWVSYQAKTDRPYTEARETLLKTTGRSACQTRENADQVCKVSSPAQDGGEIWRYVEVSRVDGINIGCKYELGPKG